MRTTASNNNLTAVGRVHQINNIIQANASQGGTIGDRAIATAMEALIGAVYLDSGKNMIITAAFIEALDLGNPHALVTYLFLPEFFLNLHTPPVWGLVNL